MSLENKVSSEVSPVRKRKVQNNRRLNSLTPSNLTQHWTFKEKRAILRGLKEYGGSDPSKLVGVVKTKTVEQISRFIEVRKRRCAISEAPTKAPIDLWLDKAQRTLAKRHDFSKGLPKVFSNCVQSGYHDVYQFLIHLLKFDTPPALTDASSSVLLSLLDDLATVIKSMDIEELAKSIKEYMNADSSCSALAKNNELDRSNDNLYTFYNSGATGTLDKEELDSFNPLKLPPAFLRNVFLRARENKKNLIDSEL